MSLALGLPSTSPAIRGCRFVCLLGSACCWHGIFSDAIHRATWSVIGREIEPVVKRFLTLQPQRFAVAEKDIRLQGVVVEIHDGTGKAMSIQRVSEKLAAQ